MACSTASSTTASSASASRRGWAAGRCRSGVMRITSTSRPTSRRCPSRIVEVTVHQDVLTIRGERKAAEDRRYLYDGRTWGRFERAITLPEEVQTDGVQAELSRRRAPGHVAREPRDQAQDDRVEDQVKSQLNRPDSSIHRPTARREPIGLPPGTDRGDRLDGDRTLGSVPRGRQPQRCDESRCSARASSGRRACRASRRPGLLPLDVSENENEFVVKASLPGVKPEDVQITVHGDTLTIQGETKVEEEKKGERWHLRERRFGQFQRSLSLATPVEFRQGPGRLRARGADADPPEVRSRPSPGRSRSAGSE